MNKHFITDSDHSNLLYKVARAYYEDDLTQEQIGWRFGLSRIKISRLLCQARREKIVQITLVMPSDEQVEMERTLEASYGLDEVLIAQPTDDSPTAIRAALGETAANCLMRTLVGEGEFTDDPTDTVGGVAVCHVKRLQELLVTRCVNGFEHHVAMVRGHAAKALAEAAEKYLGWEFYRHN